MNYDHSNKVHVFWRENILPHLAHRFTVQSFDDYLKKFSFLPSGKWLKDFDNVNVARVVFAMDPEKLVRKYTKQCIAHNFPAKPEDGMQRVIYQLSPTLHMEVAIWVWVEHEELNSYAAAFICYHNNAEYLKVLDDMYEMRRTGNTEDKIAKAGFADFLRDNASLVRPECPELTTDQKSV